MLSLEGRLGILGMHFCKKGGLPGERGQAEEDGRTPEMRRMPRPGREQGGEREPRGFSLGLSQRGELRVGRGGSGFTLGWESIRS